MPRVSIIISCYNLGAYLQEAVNSARLQSYQDCEIIVADDGSQEHATIKALDAIQDPHIKVLRLAHAGLSSTRNRGIAYATGEFICCLDADDKYHPGFVQRCLEEIKKDPGIGVVSSWLESFGESSVVWKTAYDSPVALASSNCIHVASMFRREAWAQTGGYRVEMAEGYEDWDFWLEIVLAGWRCMVIPEVLFYYRRRKGSMISSSHVFGPALYRRIIERHPLFYRENHVDILVEKQKQIAELQTLIAAQDDLIRQRGNLLKDAERALHKNAKIMEALTHRSIVGADALKMLALDAEIRIRLQELSQQSACKPLPVAIFGSGSRGRLVYACLDQELFRVEAWFDSNPAAQGTMLESMLVQSPVFRPDCTVIIASIESTSMRKQLLDLGYTADSIVEV